MVAEQEALDSDEKVDDENPSDGGKHDHKGDDPKDVEGSDEVPSENTNHEENTSAVPVEEDNNIISTEAKISCSDSKEGDNELSKDTTETESMKSGSNEVEHSCNRSGQEGDEKEQEELEGGNDSETFEFVEKEDAIESLHEREMRLVGAEILFPSTTSGSGTSSGSSSGSGTSTVPEGIADEWNNLKWIASSGTRKLRYVGTVAIQKRAKKGLFPWSTPPEEYHIRKLVIYEEPRLILILRLPKNLAEICTVLDLPQDSDLGDEKTVLRSYLVAERVIDPIACKLRLSPLTTITSVENQIPDENPRRRTCFELLTPSETVVLSAIPLDDTKMISLVNNVAFLETKKVEVAIANALFDAHGCASSEGNEAAEHQLVLGTLHAFVISGSLKLLEQALAAACISGRAPTHVIDAVDKSGQTALHYACLRRSTEAVSLLIQAGADCGLPTAKGFYPVHLSAQMLDERSLSMILAATIPERPNPNVPDDQGRTPMYVAIIDGRAPCEVENGKALSLCLAALEAWGGKILLETESDSTLLHPIRVLAREWRSEVLRALLSHLQYRFPLQPSGKDMAGSSLGAMYGYPVHIALRSFLSRLRILRSRESGHGFDTTYDELKIALCRTLQVFFEHGFEPNERAELHCDNDGVMDMFGSSPIQILAVGALDWLVMLNDSDIQCSTAVEQNVNSIISTVADLLVRSGARTSLEPPPASRLSRISSSLGSSPVVKDADEVMPGIGRASLKIDANKELMQRLGGEERLRAAKKIWLEHKNVKGIGRIVINQNDKVQPECSLAPGGSDDKTCAICWRAFGTLMNRKHRCRVTQRYVCEECSSKRINHDGADHRLSDGQFLLATADLVREKAEKVEEQSRLAEARKAKMLEREKLRQGRLMEEQSSRESLLGGLMDKATALLLGEDEEQDGLGGLTASLNQTRDALNERGDRLNALSEKTAKLMDSSAEFAKMAKDLERSQRGFW